MLSIRMQRIGRKGHAMFRMVVQESRLAPTSGRVVAQLGSYDPHAKTITLDKEKAGRYLQHGAQPSSRVVSILKREGIALPAWVKQPVEKKAAVRHPEKLRRNVPKEVPAEATAEATEAAA